MAYCVSSALLRYAGVAVAVELQDVNLSGCFQLVERALVALSVGCSQLQKVNLKACPKVTLLAVTTLVRNCPCLVSLNLSGVLQCTNAMLAAISAYCPQLRELIVAHCESVSDAGVRHLATRADQFEVLDFSGCFLLSDTGLSYLLDSFQSPKIEHLYLVGCALITQDSIARFAFACPLLLTLSVHVRPSVVCPQLEGCRLNFTDDADALAPTKQGCRVSARVLRSLSSSWRFGVLRVPTGAESSSTSVDMGIFPMHRAKDRRFVAETYTEWLAVVKIQVCSLARDSHV